MPYPGRGGSLVLAVTLVTGLGACARQNDSPPSGAGPGPPRALRVAAVNYPLAYMAERIGGETVEVVLPVPADVDPAFWRPRPEAVALFQEADLILLNGAGYARWVRTAALPRSRTVDTSADLAEHLIEGEGALAHSHGPQGEHDHGAAGLASTTWLDLELAIRQASAVRAALSARRPEASEAFDAGFEALANDLRALDERLTAAIARAPERPVLFSHPVYDYLARRYAIRSESLHWEPDEDPGIEGWRRLDDLVADSGARWLVWEAQPLAESVARLRERGIESVVFSPCGNRPAEGDLLDVLGAGAAALERVYGPP